MNRHRHERYLLREIKARKVRIKVIMEESLVFFLFGLPDNTNAVF
jgi:hypothetical protein